MKNPRCIVISGIDGSGKTTLVSWLVKYLRSKGYRAKYVWIKSKHTFAYLISQILEPLGWQRTFRNPNGIIISRFELYDSRFARKVWPTIEFLSALPLIIFKVKLPLLLGYRIVLDRYMIDTITSIALSTKNMKFADSFLGRLLLKMMPKGSASILLDIDLSTVLERRPDIEYSYDEIRNAIGLYRTLTRKMKSVSLDTDTLAVEQTKKRVLELFFVTELMPKVPIERAIILDFSMVIPTVNRAMKLKALLESILGQEILPKEIIMVDQSDNRLTFNMVNEMKQSFLDRKILLRCFHINQKSSSKARNLGIDHSTAEIVFVIDDDVILSTDYTKSILKVYESFSDAVGVQGIILNPEPSWNLTSAGRLENQLKKAFFLSHYQENTWKIMPSINDIFPFPLTTVVSTQRMQGCCSFRRKLLDIFRYDENLEGWSFLEDFDLSYRIYKSKIGSLYITPEAKITHKEHIHMSYSLKNESYKKIVNRTYMFFKLIEQTPRNGAIFCWSIFGFWVTTTLGTILGRKKEKNRWVPIYLIQATLYSLKHLREIKQLNLNFLSNIQ